jgi:hypothetical protein
MPITGTAPNKTFSRTDGTRSGSNTWQQADSAGVGILSADHDAHDEDVATALRTMLMRDGGNQPTANIDWGGYKITNVSIEATAIGASTPGTGAFTSLSLSGDLVTSDTDFRIYPNTTDGNDTARVALLSGGAFSTSRGAYIFVCGNEHATTPGNITIGSGNVSGGSVDILSTSTSVRVSSTSRAWSVTGGVSDLIVERAGNAGISIVGLSTSTSSLSFGDEDDERRRHHQRHRLQT